MPTWDQVRGIVERGITLLLAWLVLKGYIGKEQVADYTTAALAVLSIVYGIWINRPKAIIQSAAALPETKVVTSNEIALATPENNIVSADTNTVVPKTTEELNLAELARH